MKKVNLLLVLLLTSTVALAQVKKPTLRKPTPVVKDSSAKLSIMPVSDTTKIRVLLYAKSSDENTFITWEDGFLVNTSIFTPVTKVVSEQEAKELKTDKDGNLGLNKVTQKLYSKKWVEYNFLDIYDIKQVSWK